MRTLAALVFIAAMAGLAIQLMRTPTVADGRVIAGGLLDDVRKDGVTGIECDPAIPIGLAGAAFTCTAELVGGATQVVEYTMKPDGQYAAKPHPPTQPSPGRERKRAADDPRADRP